MSKLKSFSLVLAVLCVLSTAFTGRAADTNSAPATETKHAPKSVKPEQAQKLIADKKVVVLDVRTPAEFAAGHIAGATNIDFRATDFQARVATLDKHQAYLVHCAAGQRSAKACAAMEKLDFATLYDLKGGLSAWQDAGLPVEK